MDETSICLFQGVQTGNVFITRRNRVTQNISASARRTYLTHVAFACDDSAIQKVLPHVVIANTHTIPDAQLAALRRSRPSNFRLVTRSSAWVDADICALIIAWLAEALAPFMWFVQPILLFDGYGPHFNIDVVNMCRKYSIWPIVVPAKLTWLLQPLDTHVFLAYKNHLRRAYQLARIGTSTGVVGLAELLACIYVATQNVIESCEWGAAFDHNGFGHMQTRVSARVLSWIELDAPLCAPSHRPTEDRLRACFPRRAQAVLRYIMGPFDSSRLECTRGAVEYVMPKAMGSTLVAVRTDAATTSGVSTEPPSTVAAVSGEEEVPVGRPLFLWGSRRRVRAAVVSVASS